VLVRNSNALAVSGKACRKSFLVGKDIKKFDRGNTQRSLSALTLFCSAPNSKRLHRFWINTL
jgi:hypothetical protein